MIERAFLAVMNANDRELGLPLTAWAERNLLKRRIAVAVQAVVPTGKTEEQMEDNARDWLDQQCAGGSSERNSYVTLFSEDWVIDAFIAGMKRAAGGGE